MRDVALLRPRDFRVKTHLLAEVVPAYSQFAGEMYAGLLPMDNDARTGETMFWLFQPERQLVAETLVIWLNGGPGCSSFNCGVLMENSPVTMKSHDAGYCCLEKDQDFVANKHTWTRATTMLYVEHPVGTGFSHGSAFPETEAQASADLDAFLQNFLRLFDRFQNYNIYVTGESYAGMFIPSIARHIHRANKEALATTSPGIGTTGPRIHVKLSGAAIGNGWIDAQIQGPAVIDYSWWHGLIDRPTRDALHVEWRNCMARFARGDARTPEPPPFHPFNVVDDCGIMWGVLAAAGNPNAYDVSTWDPNVDQVTFSSEDFFNNSTTKEALHAPPNVTWHGCREGDGRRLSRARRLYMDDDRPFSVVPYIAELVDDGISVVVYNGDRDMTTNMVGSELALNAMEWNGQDQWLDAKRGLWTVDSYPAGWAKELGHLTYVVVYNSGHMVPYNRPNQAYDLIVRLLKGKKFVDKEAPLVRVKPLKGIDVPDLGLSAANIGISERPLEFDGNFQVPSMMDGYRNPGAFELMHLVAGSMALGALLAYTVMKLQGSRSHAGRGRDYSEVNLEVNDEQGARETTRLVSS